MKLNSVKEMEVEDESQNENRHAANNQQSEEEKVNSTELSVCSMQSNDIEGLTIY